MEAALNAHIVEEFIQHSDLEFRGKRNFWNAQNQIKDNIKMNLRESEKLWTGFIWPMAIVNEGKNDNDYFHFIKCCQFLDLMCKYYFLKEDRGL